MRCVTSGPGVLSPFIAPYPIRIRVFQRRVMHAPSLRMSSSDDQHHRLPSSYPARIRFFTRAGGCALPLWGCRAPMTSIIASHPPLPVPSLSFFIAGEGELPLWRCGAPMTSISPLISSYPGCLRIFITGGRQSPVEEGGLSSSGRFPSPIPLLPGYDYVV